VPTIRYRELKRRYQLDGPDKTVQHLREALTQGHLKPEDFSLRDLAEGLVPDGCEWVRMLDPRSAGGVHLLEAGEAVDLTAFLNVTGQVIYSRILEAYQQEAFVVSRLVDTVPTRLDGEKIPGIGRISDEATEVRPGMPYGRYRREELWEAASRSRCCCYLADDDRGPLALAEILLCGCPTVGVPTGAPFVELGRSGVLLNDPKPSAWLEAVAACHRLDRREVAALAAGQFDAEWIVEAVLAALQAARESRQ
jgi:hypothetical protein